MKDFWRSLRYLKPYSKRLTVAVGCVVVISVLWGAGLGMLLPAMKVLISKEGFHGWAWTSVTEDKLEANVVLRVGNDQTKVEGQSMPSWLDVVDLTEDGAAAKAKLKSNDTIIGVSDGNPEHAVMSGNATARLISQLPDKQKVTLRVFNAYENSTRSVEITLGETRYGSAVLARIASWITEPTSFSQRFPILLWVLGIGLAFTILRDIMRFTQEYLVQTAVFEATMDIRCKNYNVALRLPTTFFAEKGTSDTMSRFIQDTGEISRGMITLFGKTLVEPGKAIAALVLALCLSWKLTLIAMTVGPITILVIGQLGKTMKKASRRALEGWSSMLAVLEETLTGIRVVKAYTMEGTERKRFFRMNRQLLKQQFRIARVDSATAPLVEALGISAALVAVALAGYKTFHGQMDPERFITWMGALIALFDPVRKLAKVATRFQRADAAAKRVFELTDQPQEKRIPGAPMLPAHSQSIEFSNISFRYPNAAEESLKEINLKIDFGETVAIVGPNGSGKTTLVSLLPRLMDPTSGQILIDGRDIMTHSLRALRRQIAVVTQESVLFNATIGENIAYGLRRPKQEDVLAAAKQAFVDDFVRDLPDGYNTMVGEHGATLSGGQRQRITIARAILRDPRILIFDEALSQIDPDSEQKIHQAMEGFIQQRTTLMIAHRFSTVISADKIVVVNEGRLEDVGTHKQLLDRCTLYQHLYRTQFVNDQ